MIKPLFGVSRSLRLEETMIILMERELKKYARRDEFEMQVMIREHTYS